MTSSLNAKVVRRSLRPPSARAMLVYAPFSSASPACPGMVLTLAEGEPAVSVGAGTVLAVERLSRDWPSAVPSNFPVWKVTMDHGGGLTSVVGGLESVQVAPRQYLRRGCAIGVPHLRQVLLQIIEGQRAVNPALVNRHFDAFDPPRLAEAVGWLDPAPDVLARSFTTPESVILEGTRQFNYPPSELLINVAFNGSGTASGLSLGTPNTLPDYWNDVLPDHVAVPSDCALEGTWQYVEGQNVVQLRESYGALTAVRLMKLYGFNQGGTGGAAWSTLMNRWIGAAPLQDGADNIFRLYGMGAGSYSFYVFAQGAAGSFVDIQVDGSSVGRADLPGNPSAFVLGTNYALVPVVVPALGEVIVRVVGKACGLQVYRAV